MALNNARGNGVKKFDTTYYSRAYFMNPTENCRINVTYSSGLMKLTIATSDGTNNDNGFKNWNDQISVSLTGTKATSLLKSIETYEKAIADGSITMNDAYGVVTGMSDVQTIIQFHLNKVNSGKALSIAQIDKSGAFIKRFTFEFPDDYDFRIEWTNKDNMQFNKVFDNNLQFEMLKSAIKEFAVTSNGAAGYNTWDIGRYEISSIRNDIAALASASGIQLRNNNSNYNRNSGGGYFSTGGNQTSYNNNSSQNKTLDEIQSQFNMDDDDE